MDVPVFLLLTLSARRSVVDICGGSRWYPPLLPGRVDPLIASNDMELQLRTLTEQHREVCTCVCVKYL